MKTKKNEILTTAICSFILASIITILKLCIKDFYLKTYTLPFTLLLIVFLFLTFYLKMEKNKKALVLLIPIVLILGGSFIPIAFVILSLLASADQYFNSFIDTLLTFLHNSEKWDTILNNLLKILFYFIIIFNVYRNANKSKKEKQNIEIKTKDINETIIKTILFIINTVFILFLISEISKLTINFLELPTEYTYASYAREGFFQLLFVTVINFVIITYVLYYTNTLDKSKNIKRHLLVLIIFSIILIFNSYYHMFLYMNMDLLYCDYKSYYFCLWNSFYLVFV